MYGNTLTSSRYIDFPDLIDYEFLIKTKNARERGVPENMNWSGQ